MADAEAIAACGGWALTIPTAMTVQNCRDVSAVHPVDADLVKAMAVELVDIEIAAIKIGLLADMATLDAVVEIVRQRPGVPVVADPVLKAGGGASYPPRRWSAPTGRACYRLWIS
ncbi:hydroxymethylpyrimidine/phosphomethylpyrimidine kinase [Halomonas elongata]|uniref:Hydroxymethylpyrimidine/phosphomethylpyrimidine kinase n=1 Tax=Halomonas elongata TaxID=2746 RepID=A0A1B8NZ28_HALEL|nr:hydroxymethylpyrimidine/phosphomethylpyrimidine kinase [Halomonas elongata]